MSSYSKYFDQNAFNWFLIIWFFLRNITLRTVKIHGIMIDLIDYVLLGNGMRIWMTISSNRQQCASAVRQPHRHISWPGTFRTIWGGLWSWSGQHKTWAHSLVRLWVLPSFNCSHPVGMTAYFWFKMSKNIPSVHAELDSAPKNRTQ